MSLIDDYMNRLPAGQRYAWKPVLTAEYRYKPIPLTKKAYSDFLMSKIIADSKKMEDDINRFHKERAREEKRAREAEERVAHMYKKLQLFLK